MNNILGINSQAYGTFLPMANQQIRHEAWRRHLIDDDKGNIVNSSGTLHYDDHRQMLEDVKMSQEYADVVFSLLNAVPGVNVTADIGMPLVGYQDMNSFTADVSMDGSDREMNQTDYAWTFVPLPIYHGSFGIPWRQQGFSYKQGDGVQEQALRVRQKREETLILGSTSIAVSTLGSLVGLTGLTNSPGTLLQPASMTDWALVANVDTVYDEAIDLIDTMFTDDRSAQIPNSILMVVANDIITGLGRISNLNAGSNVSNLNLIKSISAVKDVVASQFLPAGSVLLIELSPTVIKIPTAQDVTIAPWLKVDPMQAMKWTVWAASTLQVRQDRSGRSGVSFATKA